MTAPFTTFNRPLNPVRNLLAGRPILTTLQVNLRCNSACGYCGLPLNVGRLSDPKTNTLFMLSEATMKQMLRTANAFVLMTGVAFAQAETPVIDQRQANEEQRVDQGIASGQLNEREVDRLNTQRGHINKMEDKAKSAGIMTKKERARIAAAQDRAARHIAREKHDRQGKRRR